MAGDEDTDETDDDLLMAWCLAAAISAAACTKLCEVFRRLCCCLPDELMEVDDDAERLSYLESSEWFVLEPTDTESSLTFFLLT